MSPEESLEIPGLCGLQCILNRVENNCRYNGYLLSLEWKISSRMSEICTAPSARVPIGKSPLGRFQYPYPSCSLIEHGDLESACDCGEIAECAIEEEEFEHEIKIDLNAGTESETHSESRAEAVPKKVESSNTAGRQRAIDCEPRVIVKENHSISVSSVREGVSELEAAFSEKLHLDEDPILTASESAIINHMSMALKLAVLQPMLETAENEGIEAEMNAIGSASLSKAA